MNKGGISHAETRSKIGQHRVRKEEDESLPLFSFTLRRGRSVGGGVAELGLLVKIVHKIGAVFDYWSKIVHKCGCLPAFSTCI